MLSTVARITILAAALIVPACGTPPMSPEQQAAHTQALSEASVAQAEAEESEAAQAQAELLLAQALIRAEELQAALAVAEAAPAGSIDPDQVEALVGELAAVSNAVNLAKAAQAQAQIQIEAARAAQASAEEDAADIEAEAATDLGGFVMDLVGTVFPPAKGVSDAWLWLTPLLFKRPRDSLATVAKEAIDTAGGAFTQNPLTTLAQARELLRTVGATVGLKHTTDDPTVLAANAGKLAASSSSLDLQGFLAAAEEAYTGKVKVLGSDPAQPAPPAAAA